MIEKRTDNRLAKACDLNTSKKPWLEVSSITFVQFIRYKIRVQVAKYYVFVNVCSYTD